MTHPHPEIQEKPARNVLLLLAAYTVVLAIVAVMQWLKFQQARAADPPLPTGEIWPLLFWAVGNALIGGGLTLWYLTRSRAAEEAALRGSGLSVPVPPVPSGKLLALAVGGVLGFTTVVLGIMFVHEWWDVLTGGRANWKTNKPWIPVGLILAGLAAMFASLFSVRSEERTNPMLRRLIYGYNAVLTGMLVLAILAVLNVMGFFYATQAFDWTSTNIYTITPTTQRLLQALKQPVTVHVIVSPRDPLYTDIKTLLDTMQNHGDQLRVEYVSSRHQLAELDSKYELLSNTAMLVVTETGGKPIHQALRADDLEDFGSRMATEGQQRSFKGEQAVASAITYLQEGKVKQTIYFTQDSGELRLNEMSARRPRGAGGIDRGMGSLKDKLEKSNYTVKELSLGGIDATTNAPGTVPDDAFAVVLAGPTGLGEPRVAEAKVKALQDYLKRPKAKMVLLLDARRNRDGDVQPTGLEALLGMYGVQVGKNIIVHPPFNIMPDPTVAMVSLASGGDRAFEDAFGETGLFPLWDTRTIEPANPPGNYVVTKLLETGRLLRSGGSAQWAEDALRGDPEEYLTTFRDKQPQEYNKKMNTPPMPVAVTVRDRAPNKSGMPDDPVHAPLQQGEGEPRLVVFGSSSLATNTLVEQGREVYYNLFASTLAWLRGRPELIGDIQPKERKAYRMTLTEDEASRVKWLPGLTLLLGIIGGGLGVWFMRRR